MSAIQRWLALSPSAVRRIHAFVFEPATYLHPDRLPAYVPQALREQPASVVSRALLPTLGAAEELDLTQPAHRAALLPVDGLERLAVRVGVRAEAARVKRVVASDDVATLSTTLVPGDWTAAYRSDRVDAPGTPLPAATALAQAIVDLGWSTLQSACDALPAGIGQRLLMKLPLCESPARMAPDVASAAVARAYAEAVNDWDAGWDAAFATAGG